MFHLTSEAEIAGAAVQLGADRAGPLSAAEAALAAKALPASRIVLSHLREQIVAGNDPLGDAFARIRSAVRRRDDGATYTPAAIVRAMVAWSLEGPRPDRIVDPGCGSARFLCAIGRNVRSSHLIGYEIDPLAALMARANLAVHGLAKRATIELADFRRAAAPKDGRTLFIGNPPYVRHHQISQAWKQWLSATAEDHGLRASQLAGLHVHFFLATLGLARPGDRGAFITSAEWLDVNYGKVLRDVFLGPLGGQSLIIMEPTSQPFPDAATTAVIATFEVGKPARSVRFRRVRKSADLADLSGGRPVRRERLEAEQRWTRLSHASREEPEGYVELGELCRVHRGAVTGANAVWIAGDHTALVPDRFKFATVTRAREIIAAGRELRDPSGLREVVDLPADLDLLSAVERQGVQRFLKAAQSRGAHESYVAKQRRAWWAVGLRQPAPILATYMARRPPSFVRNIAGARHINIAHGIYPRDPLTETQLKRLVEYLSTRISVQDGRTYAGGLTKFEPGEMERLLVPAPAALATAA